MMRLVLVLLLAAGTAAAQPGKQRPDGRDRQMSREERERMRDDMRDAYRQRRDRPHQGGPRQARPQQMSPEERGRLRRDIEDANRDLKR